MKKIVLILAVVVGISANAYSQYFMGKDNQYGGGLFGRGFINDELFYGAYVDQQGLLNNDYLPCLPGHDLEGDQPAPIGSGALVLLSFGAVYLVAKRHNEK